MGFKKNNTAFSLQNVLLGLLLLSPILPVQAQDLSTLSAQDMITNLADQLPNVMRMVTAIAYVMGFYFVVFGIMKLKQYGEARMQMSAEHSLKGPLIFILIGTLLIYLPSSIQVGLSTFWTAPNPYAYLQDTNEWADFMKNCFLIIQLFGVIAVIRGLVILSHLSGHAQHGTLGRGLTHIIGGIFCINLYQFVQVILITLGIQT